MNVTKIFGLAAVGALLAVAAPAQSALALSLSNPGAAAAVQENAKDDSIATQVHWRRHHHHWRGHHRGHRWHHHRHHHRHWHRW
jgi:hypothetical protein